jgi:hypothetical protein
MAYIMGVNKWCARQTYETLKSNLQVETQNSGKSVRLVPESFENWLTEAWVGDGRIILNWILIKEFSMMHIGMKYLRFGVSGSLLG